MSLWGMSSSPKHFGCRIWLINSVMLKEFAPSKYWMSHCALQFLLFCVLSVYKTNQLFHHMYKHLINYKCPFPMYEQENLVLDVPLTQMGVMDPQVYSQLISHTHTCTHKHFTNSSPSIDILKFCYTPLPEPITFYP